MALFRIYDHQTESFVRHINPSTKSQVMWECIGWLTEDWEAEDIKEALTKYNSLEHFLQTYGFTTV